jgi:hypothetical protein
VTKGGFSLEKREAKVNYKVYVLDSAGRISSPFKTIECADDNEALEQAKRYLSGSAVEVWQHNKLIVRLEPPNSKPLAISVGGRGA